MICVLLFFVVQQCNLYIYVRLEMLSIHVRYETVHSIKMLIPREEGEQRGNINMWEKMEELQLELSKVKEGMGAQRLSRTDKRSRATACPVGKHQSLIFD